MKPRISQMPPQHTLGPVPFLLTYCPRAKNTVTSSIQFCSKVWCCICLSFLFYRLSAHSLPFCPPNWPCLLKANLRQLHLLPLTLYFAAGRRCLLEPKHAHIHTHATVLWSVSVDGQEGGRLRMTTTAHVALSTIFKRFTRHTHTHTFINPLTKSIYFLPCIAALSPVVKKWITLQIASDGNTQAICQKFMRAHS